MKYRLFIVVALCLVGLGACANLASDDGTPSDATVDEGAEPTPESDADPDASGDSDGDSAGSAADPADDTDAEDPTAAGDNPAESQPAALTGYWVDNGQIYHASQPIHLFGVNWFGFEGSSYAAHGLWARNYEDMIAQMVALGFNAVRLPFCPTTLDGVTPSSIDSSDNPDLSGLNSLELLDVIISELDEQGLYILLDHHRPDCSAISELWYTSSYTEDDWIADLTFVAERYRDLEHFIGIDLKNEPYGEATWGMGDDTTDWDSAVERAAATILAANPDILIFVEGIQENAACSSDDYGHWWGGNLEPVACYPLDIDASRLVLSPHVYGPDVYSQSYFSDASFPDNMPAIWETHFGFAADEGYAVVPGEFGGRYGEGVASDADWQDALIDYFIDKGICDFFYWCWNPNSSDTGGILEDDWETVSAGKYNNLLRLMTACQGE